MSTINLISFLHISSVSSSLHIIGLNHIFTITSSLHVISLNHMSPINLSSLHIISLNHMTTINLSSLHVISLNHMSIVSPYHLVSFLWYSLYFPNSSFITIISSVIITFINYYHKRLFLWMLLRKWQVLFHCPHCKSQHLRSKGVYNHVRLVLDIRDFYYLTGEYMDCNSCNGTFVSWDNRMLQQLYDGVRACFPIVLTRKCVCDQSIVTLLHSRTLGKSSTMLRNQLDEVHSEEWLRRQLHYLSDCQHHKRGLEQFHQLIPCYDPSNLFRHLNGS